MKNFALILLLLFSYSSIVFSQAKVSGDRSVEKDSTVTDEQLVLVKLKDKREFVGYVISEDREGIILKTVQFGEMRIIWKVISSIEDVKEKNVNNEGKYLRPNLQCTRYFFGPSGFGLKKGEGYYQNVLIMFNQASYGFTDYFSMGVGTVPTFLFGGATPVWVVPKFSFPIDKDFLNIGVGGLFGTVLGEDASFGIAFGNVTLGNRNNNLSVSVGFGMIDGHFSSKPTFTLSGMLRLSNKTYLITENFVFNEFSLIMIGGRSFIDKAAIDYGLAYPKGAPIAIPWLGITIPFGKARN